MIKLVKPALPVNVELTLGGSKSVSNRLLVIETILNASTVFENLSLSDDTIRLQKALRQMRDNRGGTINVGDAGTDLRFLTAYLAITEGEWILTGSERIRQRPIGELVTALKNLGASVQYLGNDFFAPLKIKGKKLAGGRLQIDGSISSQFISALLLIAPTFENGLELDLTGDLVSQPYIQLTIGLLKEFGIKIERNGRKIRVFSNAVYTFPPEMTVESDWSSASYWFSICALSPGSRISLRSFRQNSLQADAVLPSLFSGLGVNTEFAGDRLLLSNIPATATSFNHDFRDCPDIAQTIAVVCAALGIRAKLSGLKTLKLKETDRITALQAELRKFGVLVEKTDDTITIKRTTQAQPIYTSQPVNTYNDHRMAMSFAPLALLNGSLYINEPQVVAKSYPTFWQDLKSAGFNVNLQP